MKLVRARIKSVEETDPRLLCCAERIQWHKDRIKEGEVKLDMDSIKELHYPLSCSFCGCLIPIEVYKEVLVYESKQEQCCSGLTFLDYFDIDEAPCPPSN